MELMSSEALEILASYFRLMANPTRLALLQRICTEEHSVSELMELTGQKQTNVSKHLGKLHQVGLVRRRAEGGQAFYSLAQTELSSLCEAMRKIVIATQEERRERLTRGA